MTDALIIQAARQFGKGEPVITLLGDGLIHKTYKVEYAGEAAGPAIVLQCINTQTFPQPENIVLNYRQIEAVVKNNEAVTIAALVPAVGGEWLWKDAANHYWRATRFIDNTHTVLIPATPEAAQTAARCFAQFTRALASLELSTIKIILPGFHDLNLRYRQFETAIQKAPMERLLKSTHVIAELRQRKHLVDFYNSLQNNPAFPMRIMHHDCKMSNVLLDQHTQQAIAPIDLDTTQPGYFFSDLGDMIRSMAGTVDENSTRWEDIAIRASFYKAIIAGYLEGLGDMLTAEEQQHLHKSGLILLFMQSMRFVTDFLHGDVYYQTTYPEQNLNRALNQLILLEKLEAFLITDY